MECHEWIASVTARVRGSKKKEAHGTNAFCIIGAVVVMLAVLGYVRLG
jgi:hypothetical protein